MTFLGVSLVVVWAALGVVAPRDGETVPLLKPGHTAYLDLNRKARFRAIDDRTLRANLLEVGALPQAVCLTWSGATNAVYEVSLTDSAAREQAVVVSNRTDICLMNLTLGTRYHWMVRGAEEFVSSSFVTAAQPPRLLYIEGLSNFRDLGGWQGRGGKRVRENMIFRSAGLRSSSKRAGGSLMGGRVTLGARRVSEQACATLADEFGIRTDLELRSVQECAGMEDSLVPRAKWVHVPFAAYDFIDNLVRGKEPFARIFRVFADASNYPVLMHCSGGRDRTGTIAFLLNGLLGVSEEDLLRDWEFSAFSDAGEKFNTSRITRLLAYLNTLPGKDINARIEFYALSCGILPEEIETFRKIML